MGAEAMTRPADRAVRMRGWLVATVSAAALIGAMGLASPACAQQADPPAASTERQIPFNIPSQDLNAALLSFASAAGVQTFYDASRVQGLRSTAVTGAMTPQEALRRLLSGTGMTFRFTSATMVALERLPQDADVIQLDPVTVEGTALGESAYGPVDGYVATRSATGTKTDTPISEVPQSVSVITRDQIDARGGRSLGDALAYSAGVTTGVRGDSSGLSDDNILIRGFGGAGTVNEYWDGLRVLGTNFAASGIEPYLFERIEVLRGPSSVLYGQNQPGGIVNSVSKQPPVETQGEVQVIGGSFDTKGLNLDLGGLLTTDGTFSYRIVGILSDQDAQTDYSGRERKVVAPSLSWRPTPDTKLTVQSIYQHDDADGGVIKTLPALGTLHGTPNGRISRKRFAGEPNYDKWDREIFSVGYLFDHRFDETWSVRQNARFFRTELDMETIYVTSLQGDGRTATRSAYGALEHSNVLSFDNQAEATFDTGALHHTLLMGLDLQRHESDTLRRFAAAPTLDLYEPVYYQAIPRPPIFQSTDNTTNRIGVYVQNQIKWDGWILTLGGRHDWADSKTTNNLAGTATKTSDAAFTGRIGLGYAFTNGLTPYASFAQSFDPQSGIDFAGNNFKPTTSEQYEIGIKYELPGHNAFITLSAFDLTQQNMPTPDPGHPGFNTQTGEIRSRGIELEGVASFDNGWSFLASYNYLDQEVTKSNGPDMGKRPTVIPRHQAALWGTYAFDARQLSGLKVGGGVRYIGSTMGDKENTFKVPAYTLFDASLEYGLSALDHRLEGATVAINATNLADKTYVASCYSDIQCYYGIGRSVIARLKYEW